MTIKLIPATNGIQKTDNNYSYPEKPITESTNDCLWELNFQHKELFWIDGGHKRVFGYKIENAPVPQSFWESHLHPDDQVRVLTKLNKMITEGVGHIWEDEYRFQRADGEYVFVHDRGHIIYDGDKGASRMIGATQDITARKLLMEERLSKQREITDAVLRAQENERSSIGKELHDNLSQILSVTKMYIQMAKTSEKEREVYLDKAGDFILEVIQEIRKISKTLIIPGIKIIGLFDNIKSLLNDMERIQSIKIEFNTEDINENELDEKLQINIFRIIQEQLSNILKHSIATLVTISLTEQENEVVLLISDNGVGCNPLNEIKGVGILNIRGRAELYGGTVGIVSEPGEGYELKVTLPLNGCI